jgi:hypothetical protein
MGKEEHLRAAFMRRWLPSAVGLCAFALLGLTACGGADRASTRPASTPPSAPASTVAMRPLPERRLAGRRFVAACDNPRVTGGLDASYRKRSVIVGPLALYPARSEYPSLSRDGFRRKSGADGVPRFNAIEAVATVAPGSEVTITIPRPAQAHVALLFDHTAYTHADRGYAIDDGETAVTLPGCYMPYTQYQGGFVVNRPGCVPLAIHLRGQRQPIQRVISFGAGRCA